MPKQALHLDTRVLPWRTVEGVIRVTWGQENRLYTLARGSVAHLPCSVEGGVIFLFHKRGFEVNSPSQASPVFPLSCS